MIDLPSSREFYPLSVVIATLGGDTLMATINSLNQGIRIPMEVLVCIPESESACVDGLPQSNVKIIKTPCRGQVAQRAYGLRRVSQDLVLQLDDDVILQPEDLHMLVQELAQLGNGHAVAPLCCHLSTKNCMTRYNQGIKGFFQSCSAFFICGAPWGVRRAGLISPAGIGYGVDRDCCGQDPVEVQWIPGGCVLCYKENLITEDYYPFAGKAYAEDLIHSVLWRQKGVRLWFMPNVLCMTSVVDIPFSWISLRQAMLPHIYVVKLIGGQVWRLKLWYVMHAFKRILLIVFK